MKLIWIEYLTLLISVTFVTSSLICRQKLPPEEANFHNFATKTPYELIHGGEEEPKSIEYPGCNAQKMWLLSRHGTRYPDKDHIQYLQNEVPILKDKILNISALGGSDICQEDIQLLEESSFNVKVEDANLLTTQGHQDLFKLAKRFQMRFPDLLKTEYNPDNYIFWTTNSNRTKESLKSFGHGLFGKETELPISPSELQDRFLKVYNYCDLRIELSKSNPSEYKLFLERYEMNKLISSVSKRLGFPVKLKEINIMYDMCRYNKAWAPHEPSAWCVVFDNDELKLLEYKQDLKYYYLNGYGRSLNKDLGCVIVQNLMNEFRDLEKDTTKGIFYFSHSVMLQIALTALSIGQDGIPLRHDNMQLLDDRKWKLSKLSSFTSNIAAVIYSCPDDPKDKKKVQMWVSEHPVMFPGCDKTSGLCPWSVFENLYSEKVKTCDLNECMALMTLNRTNPIVLG